MDPKDLKNSEELKSNLPSDPEQQNDAVDATGNDAEKTKEKEEKDQVEEITKPGKLKTKDSPVSEGKKEEEVEKPSDSVSEAKPTEENAEEAKAEEVKSPKEKIPEEDTPVVEVAKEDKNEEASSSEKEEVKAEEAKPEKVEGEKEPETEKELSAKKEVEEKAKEPEPESEKKKEEPVAVAEADEKTENVAKENIETGEGVSEKAKEETKAEEPEVVENKEPKESEAKEVEEKKPVQESTPVVAEQERIDYSTYSQVELVNALRDLLDKNEGQDIKGEVDTIKSQFYKLLKKERQEAKKKFVDEGGDEEEFKEEENPYEKDIKDLLKRFRQLRIEFNKKYELQKETNLELKYQVIEEIKNLINREESINKTFQDFRDLQAKWREIGLVPQSKMKDLWDTYHFHVENFYNYIKINKELRDLDLKKNLEAKMKLCERAEELLLETSIIKAFNLLQKLHERWREIGPVPRDKKDEIWERFKSSTSKINKKHQEYFENRKSEQKNNLEAKTALCEKVEAIAEADIKTHREWDVKSKEMIELQKVWRTIGYAPKRDNNKIYERFRTACDSFFDKRREYYNRNKELQQNNLQMKIDLCVQAESLKDSTDWRKTTQDFINIQRKWKDIGPVPRKHSDQVWKRFRAACDYFFDMKSKHFENIDEEQDQNLKLKEELIKKVEEYKVTKDVDKDLKVLKEFQRSWTEIGHVPIKKKDEVLNNFRKAVNKHFDDLKLDDSKRDMLKFRNKVSNITETGRGKNKMRNEREKYMSKLKQLENDLVLLDNNIGFFTHSKNAEALIADVNKKIENTREKIELLKNKIRIIDEYDNE